MFIVIDGNSNVSLFTLLMFLFVIVNFFLIFFNSGKRRTPQPQEDRGEWEDWQPSEQQAEQQKGDRDLAEEFERVLGKKKPKLHTDNCELKHDKGKIYTEPMLIEEEPVADVKVRQALKETPSKQKLAHPVLANAFILSEVLDKPRSLKPYTGEF